MGKVTVGTGPCFFLNEFSGLIPVQQTFWVPTQTYEPSSGVTSTPSLFSSFLPWSLSPPTLVLAKFVTLFSGRSFLQDVAGAAVTLRVPTISCPSSRITACSPVRTGSWCTRSLGVKFTNLGSAGFPLSWMGVWARDHVLLSSPKLITAKPELCANVFPLRSVPEVREQCWTFSLIP